MCWCIITLMGKCFAYSLIYMQKNSYENKDFKKSLIFGTNKVFLIYFVTLCAICKLSEFSFYTVFYTFFVLLVI